jgi:hypothetical protein
MLDMDTKMDTMSNTLLHMRHQLTESHRQITLLNEENVHLRTLCESNNNTLMTINPIPSNDSTPNGMTHTDTSNVPPSTNPNRNKRPHPSNRTTPNFESIALTSTSMNSTNDDDDNNQRFKRSVPLENGINVTP